MSLDIRSSLSKLATFVNRNSLTALDAVTEGLSIFVA